MDVKVNLTNGEIKNHNDAIFIGEIEDTRELIVGSGFNVSIYPLNTVSGGSYTVNSKNKVQSIEKLIEILQKRIEK